MHFSYMLTLGPVNLIFSNKKTWPIWCIVFIRVWIMVLQDT